MACPKKWKHNAREGGKTSPTYYSWSKMKERCNLKSHIAYSAYGGKGIKVCERWRNSFDNFVDDMGERPKGKTLDRIDSNKGYFKENCRWATPKEQQNNLKSNIRMTINGIEKTVSEWARVYGVKPKTAHERIRRGWNKNKAVTTKATIGSNQWGG